MINAIKQKCPISFKINDFLYLKVDEGRNWAIYAQTDEDKPEASDPYAFELVSVGTYWRIPNNEDFGKVAWTYRTLPEAQEKATKTF